MPIPSMGEVLLPVLRLLAGSAHNAKTCLPYLQEEFALTDVEMAELIPSGFRGRVFDRADWAIFHLMKAGLVDRTSRGVYATSTAGKTLLGSGRPFGWPDLTAMPQYRAAMQKAAPEDEAQAEAPATAAHLPPTARFAEDVTPEEEMRRGLSAASWGARRRSSGPPTCHAPGSFRTPYPRSAESHGLWRGGLWQA